ncbi:hypothetical protein TEA_027129 [Camellia sinensis var. sinensis]|uniref:Exonuclease domain-containing protein n=1 Tax=Camellia sinensis var. sinensis TaxID=542762 RepID=A0A4S4EA20_CAMSN|nr:hypothetical protein TEA_027129 [Camellia sinensis var. sinensis]
MDEEARLRELSVVEESELMMGGSEEGAAREDGSVRRLCLGEPEGGGACKEDSCRGDDEVKRVEQPKALQNKVNSAPIRRNKLKEIGEASRRQKTLRQWILHKLRKRFLKSTMNLRKGAVFRSAVAALSLSMVSKSSRGCLWISKAEASIQIVKVLGVDCDGKEGEVMSKLEELEATDKRKEFIEFSSLGVPAAVCLCLLMRSVFGTLVHNWYDGAGLNLLIGDCQGGCQSKTDLLCACCAKTDLEVWIKSDVFVRRSPGQQRFNACLSWVQYSVLAIELNSDEGAAVVLLQPSCCSCAGLNTEAVLGYEVRKEGAPHNCLDDTTAAMKLVLAKIESGFDNAIPLVREGVPEIKKSKLLLHRIPVNVPDEELHKIIPGDFTIEIRVRISITVDSYGLPQKCISFQYDSGSIDSFCVRKMTSEDFLGQVSSRKRPFQAEETTTGESKKLKSCQEAGEQTKAGSNLCDGHLKEIERLKQELRQG